MNRHDGRLVEQAIRKQGSNIKELASKLGVNRRTLYNWFTQTELKADLISKIGSAISHDFSQDFPEIYQSHQFKPQGAVSHSLDYKDKYLKLLESYNELLLSKSGKDL